jgi:glycosyltransferase involved in cell wall biosynthesis
MLGVIVAAVGRQTETYIAHHIAKVLPQQTAVCSLMPCDRPSWVPEAPVERLYQSRSLAVQAFRHVLRVAAPHRLESLDLMRLRRWLTQYRIRVVLCEYLDVAVTVFNACRQASVPLIAHAHGYDIAGRPTSADWARVYADRLPMMDEIVVVSRAMKERVLKFGVAEHRIHVVPCGTQVETAARRRHADKDEYLVLAAGRLIAKKGPLFLLEAFRQIRDRGVNARLIVLGEGPFREPMQQFLQAAGLDPHVEMPGEVPHEAVRAHLSRADLFLQHSVTAANGDEEGLPVSILKAMAAGVPVVSTTHAGIPEVVGNGDTGFLVSPGDAAGMAKRSVQLLKDAPRRTAMGMAAQAVVTQRFSLERELEHLRSLVTKYVRH